MSHNDMLPKSVKFAVAVKLSNGIPAERIAKFLSIYNMIVGVVRNHTVLQIFTGLFCFFQ